MADEGNEQPQPNLPSTCNGMEYLPKAMVYNNKCLKRIYIHGCDSLTQIAIGQLPPTLKWLIINDCKNMLILLYEDDTNSCSSNTSLLQCLSIQDCPSLKSLTSSGDMQHLKLLSIINSQELESIAKSFHENSSLEEIVIWDCKNLKSLPMGIDTLTNLIRIEIRECSTLVSLRDEGLLLPVNLEDLLIFDCEKMQALPNYIHNITSLEALQIWQCPMVSFPEEGFPTNLTFLQIWDGNITESLLNWGLHKLTSLRHLEIRGGCPHLESFPEMMLPASLTSLFIRGIPNLKYLSSKGFQYVSSLKTLRIDWCENFKSFPDDGLPPSLLHPSIICCDNFTSFPKYGLPPALHRLDIANCPLLKERCKKVHGQEWLKIAHIPCIQIDGWFIYDPEEEN